MLPWGGGGGYNKILYSGVITVFSEEFDAGPRREVYGQSVLTNKVSKHACPFKVRVLLGWSHISRT